MLRDFGSSSSSLPSLTITAFLLGYVLGPLLIAPMSELYGRVWTLWPAYVLFIVTLVLCGTTSSLTTFIVVRCFMGFAANAFVIVGPAIVADIISKDQRGLALSVLLGGPILVSFPHDIFLLSYDTWFREAGMLMIISGSHTWSAPRWTHRARSRLEMDLLGRTDYRELPIQHQTLCGGVLADTTTASHAFHHFAVYP